MGGIRNFFLSASLQGTTDREKIYANFLPTPERQRFFGLRASRRISVCVKEEREREREEDACEGDV